MQPVFCPVAYCVPEILTSGSAKRELKSALLPVVWGTTALEVAVPRPVGGEARASQARRTGFGYFELPAGIPLEKAVLWMRKIATGDGSGCSAMGRGHPHI